VTPRLPTFFILGAGRCGTTSLHELLDRNPEVFLCRPKEPSFFSDWSQGITNPVDYAALFAAATPGQQTGDASHVYYSHPRAAETLAAFVPDAKFILIYRNPADRARAMYLHMVQTGFETISTFEAALAAEDRRFGSERFRRTCPHYFWNYMYFRSGLFGEQLARYHAHFPPDRFFYTTLYDLQLDPQAVTDGMARFLGVTPQPVDAFPHTNPSRGVRSARLQRLERKVLWPMAAKRVPLARAALNSVERLNATDAPPADPDTRAHLLGGYAADLALLRDLSGLDVLDRETAFRERRSPVAG
jgi:sulfotransferase family protein